MAEDKIFANGFSFKRRDNAPEWHLGQVGIKVDEAIEFLREHESKGWVNLDLNKSKAGKAYLELNTWRPEPRDESEQEEEPDDDGATDDLPF